VRNKNEKPLRKESLKNKKIKNARYHHLRAQRISGVIVGRWCLQLPRSIGHNRLGCIGNPWQITADSPVRVAVAATSIEAACGVISPSVSRKERNWRLTFVSDRSNSGNYSSSEPDRTGSSSSSNNPSHRRTYEYYTNFGNRRYLWQQTKIRISSQNSICF